MPEKGLQDSKDSGIPEKLDMELLIRKTIEELNQYSDVEDPRKKKIEEHFLKIAKLRLEKASNKEKMDLLLSFGSRSELLGLRLLVLAMPDDYTASSSLSEAIRLAIQQDNVERLRLFLRLKVNRIIESNWVTPLIYAIMHGKENSIDYLLQGVDEPDLYGITPLLWGVIYGIATNDYTTLLFLLKRELANPNQMDSFGNTPLITAIRRVLEDPTASSAMCVKILLENNADPSQADNRGRIPVMEAINLNQIGVLNLLIDHDCDLLCTNAEGEIPLQIVYQQEKISMAMLLQWQTYRQINFKIETLLENKQEQEAQDFVRKLFAHNAKLDPEYNWYPPTIGTFVSAVLKQSNHMLVKTKTEKKALDSEPKIKKEEKKSRDESKYKLENRIAHLLGLSRVAKTSTGKEAELIDFRGTSSSTGNRWVCETLKIYNENLDPGSAGTRTVKDFKEIEEAFLKAQAYLERSSGITSLLARYNQGALLVLPVSWAGHGICITLQNGFLSVSNRGEGGDQRYGTKIYTIKNPEQVETFLQKIMVEVSVAVMQGLLTNRESQDFIINALKSVVDLEHPFDQLDQKGQKRGTCAVANRKAAIQGALYILELRNTLLELGTPLESLDPKRLESIKTQCRERSKLRYKNFTNAMRNNELDALLTELRAAKAEKKRDVSLYYDILLAIILEHNDFNKKNKQQGERILKIWAELPKEYQDRINTMIPDFQERKTKFMLMYKSIKEESKKRDQNQELKNQGKSKSDDYKP